MKKINSVQNQQIKDICKLHTSKGRELSGKFIAEGTRVCKSLISSGANIEQIYATEKMKDLALEIEQEEKITIVSDDLMNKISTSKTPSGILGIFSIPEKPDINKLSSGIVMAKISDPGNLGTLIRTAAALNVKTIVLIETVDPYNPKVVQSSAGTLMQVNIFQISWEELIKNKKNKKLYALVVSGGKNPKELDFKDSLLIIGSEAHGIPENWVDQCDEKMTLPMPGNVESLNAAIAGSIALYLAFGNLNNLF